MNASTEGAISPPLWQLLLATKSVVQRVLQGRSLTVALAPTPPDLRGGVQALSFQTMRQLGRAQAVLGKLASRKPHDELASLLITALALLVADEPAYAAHVLVDQAVTAAQRSAGTRAQASFVNACLRRFLRERDALLTNLDPVATWNYPAWWIKRLMKDHPNDWADVLKASQTPAPMVLRVNVLRTSRDAFLAALHAMAIEAQAVGDAGVRLAHSHPVTKLPGFDEGWFSVQDTAAQLAAPLLLQGLDRQGPLRLLDACAAPGGKTAHLLELAPNAHVTALEIDAERTPRIHDNLARLGLQAEVRCADAGAVDTWWDGQLFDGILLDAPCSASGIVRRHPDIRWLRRPSDIDQLTLVQQRLLKQLWPVLKPGGHLVYATCSVFKAEGDNQIELFRRHHADAQRCAAPGHLLPRQVSLAAGASENQTGEHDGFFYALLQKLDH